MASSLLDPSRWQKRSRWGAFAKDLVGTLRPGHEGDAYGNVEEARLWNQGMDPRQIKQGEALMLEKTRQQDITASQEQRQLERDKFEFEKTELERQMRLNPSLGMDPGQRALYESDIGKVSASPDLMSQASTDKALAERSLGILAEPEGAPDVNLGVFEGSLQDFGGRLFGTESSNQTRQQIIQQGAAVLERANNMKGSLSYKELEFAQKSIPTQYDNEEVWQEWYHNIFKLNTITEEIEQMRQEAASDPQALARLRSTEKDIRRQKWDEMGDYKGYIDKIKTGSDMGGVTRNRPPGIENYY